MTMLNDIATKEELLLLIELTNIVRKNQPTLIFYTRFVKLYKHHYMLINKADCENHIELGYDYVKSRHMPVNRIQEKIVLDRKYINNNFTNSIGIELATFHKAKGDERDSVYILPISDLTSPKKFIINRLDREQAVEQYIEEERRVLYVAITRAINNLVIFYSNLKQSYDGIFIKELRTIFERNNYDIV